MRSLTLQSYRPRLSDRARAIARDHARKRGRKVLAVHVTKLKVRFGELDPYNHVNHSVYVAWFEAGRCEALESVDMSLHKMASLGFQIVVTDLAVKYRIPAKAGDEVRVHSWIGEMGGARSTWLQEIRRTDPNGDDVLLCAAEVRAGSTDVTGKPIRMPDSLRSALNSLLA
jgi:acyl-CoA thioester hydrolase